MTDITPIEKRLRTAQARAALAGFVLHRAVDADGDYYIVTRWNCSRILADLDEVETRLNTVTGTRECR
jgi:hypothetical protein